MEGLKSCDKPNFMGELSRVLEKDVYRSVFPIICLSFFLYSFNLSSLIYNESDISTTVLYLRL
jgi:hypothetical protein